MPWTLRMTLLVAALTAIAFIYNTARIYWYSKQTGLHSKKTGFSLIAVITILIFAYPISGWVIHSVTGSFSREWYPVWMIVLFWYGFILNAVLLNWILAIDIVNTVITWLFRFRRPQFQTLMGLFVLLITSGVFLYTSIKTAYDTQHITVERITYTNPAVENSELDPLRIVHISEIHADSYTSPAKINRYMRKVEALKPDIVLVTGDMIASGLDYVDVAADALSSVNPPLGVYFVMGDHDYWAGQDEIAGALEERGVNVLFDENMWIEHGSGILKITGVTDVYSTSVERILLRELLNETDGEQLSFLFSHQAPDDMITIAREKEIDILLTGHTHGGQIRIPVFFKKVSAAGMETNYVNGHWFLGSMLLNVNSGLGFTLAPLRYNAPAEVSVIEVR